VRLRAGIARGAMRPAEAAFGHIEVPVRAEGQPAWVVEAGRNDGHRARRAVVVPGGLALPKRRAAPHDSG
jgi:hypothetical protein